MHAAGSDREPIAIVGMSGRYPGAAEPGAVLGEPAGRARTASASCRAIGGRWRGSIIRIADEAVARGKSYSKWGGFLAGFAEFDPLFFNISPREAAQISIRRSGCSSRAAGRRWRTAAIRASGCKRRHQGQVGVFAGITKTGFALHGPELWRQGDAGLAAHLVRLGGQPGVVSSEPARSEHADRHDVLGVADGDP